MDVGLASTGKNAKMNEFWMTVMTEINQSASLDKHHELPMARIKKIMKMDDSVQTCVRNGVRRDWIDDRIRGACGNREGVRDFHPRVDAASMDAHRGEQAPHAAGGSVESV